MYNYTVFGDVNEIIRDIVSAYPANEATELKKTIYNDINFNNMLEANESSINANTGVGKLLEVMLNTVDADLSTNFSYIGKSRGDITKLKDFHAVNASINYINKINTDYGYATDKMNVTKNFALSNLNRMNDVYDILKSHKADFDYGYKTDNNVIKNTYCSLVCILIDLTCLNMIEVTEFMESIGANNIPANTTRPYVVHHSISRNGRFLNNVDKMIKIFHDGSWNKMFKVLRTNNGKRATEDAVAIGVTIALIAAIPMIAVMVIYLIRFFISFYFESAVNIRQKTSALASYISEVSKSEDDPKALYRQTKAVKTLSNISNFISTKILKEEISGTERVAAADREIKEKAYVSNAGYNQLTNGNGLSSSEIIFE
jgi:hypothetical protein